MLRCGAGYTVIGDHLCSLEWFTTRPLEKNKQVFNYDFVHDLGVLPQDKNLQTQEDTKLEWKTEIISRI